MTIELDKELEKIAAEIEGFLLSNKTKAIGAVIITDDGYIHTRFRFIEGGKIPLVAGVSILQRNILEYIKD